MAAQIQMQNLTRRFGDLTAVDHVSLDVATGEIFGLVGPDGAGKTTTLRILSGLMNSSEGEVHVAGQDVSRDVDAVKDRIGYMAQRFGLYQDLTVEENMKFYSDLFGVEVRERDQRMGDLLRLTRMEPFRKRQAGKLSGGMKQKLALMCTLLHRPQVLLLDEPTNGVDPVSRRDFWAILYQLAQDGMTIFVTTAYLDEAERCHRVGLMQQGRLIRCDTPDRLRNGMPEDCYEVVGEHLPEIREKLRGLAGVASVEPAGASLHMFIDPSRTSPEILQSHVPGVTLRKIVPSLEDVFIALVRKERPQ